jgi:hypothetical protein
MATEIGDLPHAVWNDRKKKYEWCDFEGIRGEIWEIIGYNTAHTTPNKIKVRCHCCGKVDDFVVKKPGSIRSWCLKCF